jgi:hypothetical protein
MGKPRWSYRTAILNRTQTGYSSGATVYVKTAYYPGGST